MIELTQARTTYTNIKLSAEEAAEVTEQYLRRGVLHGRYINAEGRLESWDSFPHGSGTTTDHGEPTELQQAAWRYLKALEADRDAARAEAEAKKARK